MERALSGWPSCLRVLELHDLSQVLGCVSSWLCDALDSFMLIECQQTHWFTTLNLSGIILWSVASVQSVFWGNVVQVEPWIDIRWKTVSLVYHLIPIWIREACVDSKVLSYFRICKGSKTICVKPNLIKCSVQSGKATVWYVNTVLGGRLLPVVFLSPKYPYETMCMVISWSHCTLGRCFKTSSSLC